MKGPVIARSLATAIVEALKQGGHILIAKGKMEALLRELEEPILSTVTRVMPRVLRSEVHGEVTSTFGDEATDESVEEMVIVLRETLIDSEGVEDVFAEDRVIERQIFRTVREELVRIAHSIHLEDEEEDKPPISVRLHTLGYVAAKAAELSDQETVRDALERAALAASTELDTFDASSKTAIFSAREDDPDKRLEIEEAVEEELADLVEMGLVDLPTLERKVSLPVRVLETGRKPLAKRINEIAAATLTSRMCQASWEWDGQTGLRVLFTPLAEPDTSALDKLAETFQTELGSFFASVLAEKRAAASAAAAGGSAPPSSRRSAIPPAPPASSPRTAPTAPPSSRKGAIAAAPKSKKEAAAKKTKATSVAEAKIKKAPAGAKSAVPKSAAKPAKTDSSKKK